MLPDGRSDAAKITEFNTQYPIAPMGYRYLRRESAAIIGVKKANCAGGAVRHVVLPQEKSGGLGLCFCVE